MANQGGRPVIKNRHDAEGNPNFRRCGVYLETSRFEIFNLLVNKEGSNKTTVLEKLIESWIEEKLEIYPEIAGLTSPNPETLVLPEVVL